MIEVRGLTRPCWCRTTSGVTTGDDGALEVTGLTVQEIGDRA